MKNEGNNEVSSKVNQFHSMQLLHLASSAEALRGGNVFPPPPARIEADQAIHPQLHGTSVLIDETPIVAYHSAMSDQHDNQQHNPAADPLTVGELRPLKELADELNLSYHSLRTYAKNGRLRAVKFGMQWATTRQSIQEYLDSRYLRQDK